MRIFYAADKTPKASLESNLWRNNLYLPLVDLGHDVVEFDYDFGATFLNLDPSIPEQGNFINTNRPKLTGAILEQLKQAHAQKSIDLFFSYFYDACILPEAIDEIKAMGIKTVNWYCNGSYQLHLVEEISPHYDWCLVPEKFRMKDYIAMGAHPVYCQEAANPRIYKPYDVPVEYDVTFVGQAYGERPHYIKYLLDQGIDVRVWGFNWEVYTSDGHLSKPEGTLNKFLRITRKLTTVQGWEAIAARIRAKMEKENQLAATYFKNVVLPSAIVGSPLADLEMIKMYSRSKINLGFSVCGDTHKEKEKILQVRLRDFEVPMSGGFYMVEYMEELEEFFEIGKEIVCYKNSEDLAEKIKFYLKHDDERERIRKAGYERCLKDHSWHKRFETAFKEMGM